MKILNTSLYRVGVVGLKPTPFSVKRLCNHATMTLKNKLLITYRVKVCIYRVEEAALLLRKQHIVKYLKPIPKEINQDTSTVWT